jgi:restriction system protein
VPMRESRRRPRSLGRARRAASGDLLAVDEYIPVILRAVARAGGSAQSVDVVDAVGHELEARLTPMDKQPLPTGETRWRNRVHWIRFRLVERGLIDRSAPRGVWRLTEAGKVEAARVAA